MFMGLLGVRNVEFEHGPFLCYLDKVAYKLVTKDIILDVQEQEVVTRDNAVILINAMVLYT